MLKTILLAALAFFIWIGALVGMQSILHGRVPEIPAQLILSLTLVAVYWAVARWVERRPVDELRAYDSPNIAYGIAVGFLLFVGTMGILTAANIYHFSGFVSVRPLVTGLSFALMAAFSEELLFRGFIFRWLEAGLGTWIAVAISAVLFGVAHAANPGATPISTAAIALEAGVLLSAAFVYSRTLWLPIGIHIGWNLTEGSVFGLAVSGHHATGMLAGTIQGPDWLTGGAFGVEASLPAVAICLLAAIALLTAAARSNRIVAPRWRTTATA